MKLKLPLTEDLLWGLYGFVEELGKLHDFLAPRSISQAFNPDLYNFRRHYERQRDRRRFAKIVSHLKERGYIKIKDLENSKAIIITPKGRKKILKIKRKMMRTTTKKRADGRWQMVMFDIPERRREDRESFRMGLKELGYKKLQQSIWVSPYDIFKETQDLIRNLAIEPYVKLLLVEEIKLESSENY